MVSWIQDSRCPYQWSFLWEELFLWMSHLWQIEKNILSGVHQVCIQCWALVCSRVESIWLNLFCHHCLKSDTVCWVSICLTLGVCITSHAIFYGGFKASYVFSFVKFNVFVCVIRHQNINRCFSFDAVDAIGDVNIRVPSFFKSSSVIK